MKIDLTRDELYTLVRCLIRVIWGLEMDKRRLNQIFNEEFDEMYEALIREYTALRRKLEFMLTTLEDQER